MKFVELFWAGVWVWVSQLKYSVRHAACRTLCAAYHISCHGVTKPYCVRNIRPWLPTKCDTPLMIQTNRYPTLRSMPYAVIPWCTSAYMHMMSQDVIRYYIIIYIYIYIYSNAYIITDPPTQELLFQAFGCPKMLGPTQGIMRVAEDAANREVLWFYKVCACRSFSECPRYTDNTYTNFLCLIV